MSRMPRYRRGSLVPHMIALVLLLVAALEARGDGDDVPLGRLQTLDTTVTPGRRTYLAPNRPNPFRESTMIEFSLAERATVTLRVYDFWYNEVETLIDNRELEAGAHLARFQVASNERHPAVYSGMYFYELRVGDEIHQRRMLVIR